ncbi:MAG: NAD(+) diphosphatase [Dehalococcoidia bacterium]|nr:NAD(+) diphosphatase [Dehalococcoidia bacterium]
MAFTHIFAGDPFDRADPERRDDQWIKERLAQPESRILPFWRLNPLAIAPPDSGEPTVLAWQDNAILEHAAEKAEPVLLGLRDGVAHFAIDVTGGTKVAADVDGAGQEKPAELLGLPHDTSFQDARDVATEISGEESGTLAHARALVGWHQRHGFCPNCGAATYSTKGGKERICDTCGAHHFPRTDPVAIMAVTDGERCLLGQTRARRRSRFYSALAGFIDQGESIEEAVRREVWEEGGIRVGDVRYHSSQPWPFPSSLMIGCIALATTTDIRIDPEEMTDVRWVPRDEVLEALEIASVPGYSLTADPGGEGVRVPGPIAIAHHIIKAWANGE